jgi:hypothetical protein
MVNASLPEAVESGQKALDWFDSIHGDRIGGRVLVDYDTLLTLVIAGRENL